MSIAIRVIFILLLVLLPSAIESLSSHPLLLLISLDGFRHDLLNRSTTPNLYKLVDSGVHFVNGVRSQSITYTAPNHASIATGLLEQHHGIVGNVFYDRDIGEL
jgi:predicted AlkP superfamily pyrophosphatase or phosphodiesterase